MLSLHSLCARISLVVGCLGAALALLAATPAGAATLTLGLDVEFSGAITPEGTAPWITATVDDSFGGANDVRLTLDAHDLTDAEFIFEWLFNFDPSLEASLLTIVAFDDDAIAPSGQVIFKGNDAFTANGDGKYDIRFNFPPPPGAFAKKFTDDEILIYDLSYISPISASSFNYFSVEVGGQGTFLSAAQIGGIGPSDNDSGWIGVVPEPSTFLLVGGGLLALAARRSARRR